MKNSMTVFVTDNNLLERRFDNVESFRFINDDNSTIELFLPDNDRRTVADVKEIIATAK